MLITPLFWLVVGMAGAEWIAVWRGWVKVTYFTKPATMLAIIAWFSQLGGWQGPQFWFGLGLVASLAGDVLLMLPNRFFIPGLVAFLCAHLCYLVGFNRFLPDLGVWLLIPLAIVATAAVLIFRSIFSGLSRSPGSRMMRVPVTVYGTVISLMLYSAAISFWRPGWTENAAWMACIGALLFFTSDSILAIGKFVRPVKWWDLKVMVTYELGQIALAAGALLAFGVH
jgi:uncharacterized membrane protein YhhN